MVTSGSIDNVRQLIVEFHVYTTFSRIDLTSPQDYLAHLMLLRGLYERGFRIYYFRMWISAANVEIFKNKAGTSQTGCHEVHFMRVD